MPPPEAPSARARLILVKAHAFFAVPVSLWLATVACNDGAVGPGGGGVPGGNNALRFYGNGVGDIDRVKVRVDDPATTSAGPPVDVGATDFTIEFWMKAEPGENDADAIGCGANVAWINGNIVIDRDRYNQDRDFGISLGAGRIAFGVSGASGTHLTICGTTQVDDGEWHHVAATRTRSNGAMSVFVDGALDASAASGPGGDISYPDDGVPGGFCGGPCTNSDPFLVIGAEKHDVDAVAYPAFRGWLDELRVSTTLRYSGPFSAPTAGFTADASTAGLYHFDEGTGNVVADGSGAAGGPSNGVRRFGGSPAGPAWVASDAPTEGP